MLIHFFLQKLVKIDLSMSLRVLIGFTPKQIIRHQFSLYLYTKSVIFGHTRIKNLSSFDPGNMILMFVRITLKHSVYMYIMQKYFEKYHSKRVQGTSIKAHFIVLGLERTAMFI